MASSSLHDSPLPTRLWHPRSRFAILRHARFRRLQGWSWSLLAAAALLSAGCGDHGESGSTQQAAIHLATSEAYTEQGQYRAALIEARNAIKQAPDQVAGRLQLARVHLALGNARSAAEVLAALPPGHPEAQQTLARAYVELGKYRSAIDLLTDASMQSTLSESTAAQITLAEAHAGLRHYDQAEQQLRDILARHSDAEHAAISLARVYLAQNDTVAATEVLEQLLRQNPQQPEALLLLALQARANNDLDTADRHLSAALSGLRQTDVMTPLRANILSTLADTLTRLGRPAEALVYTRLLAEADPAANEARKQFSEALSLFQAGEVEEAEKILVQLNKDNPNHAYSAMLLGLVNFQQGDYERAGELLSGNIDPETTHPQVTVAAALARMAVAPEESLRLVEQALGYHPDDVGLNAFYGTVLLRQPDTEGQGLRALSKAIDMAPDQARLRLPRAAHHIATGAMDQAREDLEQAAALAPTDPPVQNALINFYLQQQDLAAATQAVDRFVQADTDSASANLLAGRVYTRAGQLPIARKHFEQVLQQSPDQLLAHLGLGQIELMDRNAPAAESRFRQAITLAPIDQRAYMGLVTALELQQQNASIPATLETLAQQHSDEGTALAVLAQYQLRNHQLEDALASVEHSLSHPTPSPYVVQAAAAIYRNAAQQHLAAGHLDQARNAGQHALELQPDNAQAIAELAAIDIAAGASQSASTLIDALEQLPDGEPTATLLRARLALSQDEPARARQLLAERWQAQREAAIANSLHGLLLETGDTQAATQLLQDWTAQHPQDPRPLSQKAMAAQQEGRTADAIELYQRALTLAPEAPLLLNNLAWLYLETGREEALDLASRAAEAAPQNAAILDTYGWILAQSGQAEKGVEILQRALELAPDHTEIRQHLEAAQAML